jgi:hypothetical protein
MRLAHLLLLAPAFLVLSASASLLAADATAEVTALQAALASNDATAKKTAIRALSSKSVGKDAEILPLLVAAIGDRQAGEAAVNALSSRAGKTPVGGTYRVGIDPATIQAAWQSWLEDWMKTQELKKIEKKIEKKVEKNSEKIKEVAINTAETAAAVQKTTTQAPPEDLGKIDRVIFKAGGSLLCFIMSKRTDADGNLVSVRIVHPDGAGEETIAESLISRIEEDIR